MYEYSSLIHGINVLSTIQNDLLHELIDKTICIILQQISIVCCLLQLVSTDIENSLIKYRVSYRHLIFMIETFEMLVKSCEM